jgi:hypothetical protein
MELGQSPCGTATPMMLRADASVNDNAGVAAITKTRNARQPVCLRDPGTFKKGQVHKIKAGNCLIGSKDVCKFDKTSLDRREFITPTKRSRPIQDVMKSRNRSQVNAAD